MYLTRMQLNPARRESRKLLGSPQAMHAAVLAAFPQTGDERGRVLWRIDPDGHRTWLYLVSRHEPDLTHLVEQAGWPAVRAGWDTRPYDALLDRLSVGQRWAFRLTANPTRTTAAHGASLTGRDQPDDAEGRGSRRGRRYGHVTAAQQLGWLTDRAERLGVHLRPDDAPAVVVRQREVVRFRRGDATVTIARATFDGVLEIAHPARIREALTSGVGPAKAYGCGLLTLAPVT